VKALPRVAFAQVQGETDPIIAAERMYAAGGRISTGGRRIADVRGARFVVVVTRIVVRRVLADLGEVAGRAC